MNVVNETLDLNSSAQQDTSSSTAQQGTPSDLASNLITHSESSETFWIVPLVIIALGLVAISSYKLWFHRQKILKSRRKRKQLYEAVLGWKTPEVPKHVTFADVELDFFGGKYMDEDNDYEEKKKSERVSSNRSTDLTLPVYKEYESEVDDFGEGCTNNFEGIEYHDNVESWADDN
ncbi:hypothetical protein G9A89_016846 [Geosiphon pyriformis]|nr:hypothetical protein G9A89_016846 [Geosiphon pyriformis]